MYVNPNFKTKKSLKQAITNHEIVRVFSPGPFPCPMDGQVCVEGPHYPEAHKWYASVVVEGGVVKEVK